MDDLTAQVTLAGPPSLTLEHPGQYELVGVGIGGRQWRRSTVEGRYQHGRVLLGAVLDMRVLTVHVRCLGATWSAVTNRANDLFEATQHMAGTVTVTMNGVTTTYTCEAADIAPASGDTVDKFRVMANMEEYVLTIPVQPT